MRIVAADDDEQLSRVLERCLRTWGYEAVLARNGHDAWQILKRSDSPRLVILDWDMPGLSGVDVCRLLRSTPHGRDVYVLMLTGRQEKADIIQALECGADDFLAKPFHVRELQLRLAKGVRDSARSSAVRRSPSGAPPAGTTLDGKYRLEKQVAKGGMGSVWLGVHLALGVNVAIKFMDPALIEKAGFTSFDREARAAAQLRNEHIVRIYDHGIDAEGQPYLVMEYLGGESLGARLDRRGPLAPEEVALVGEQTARALTEAHGRGIIHRDIKPENIFLVDDPDRPGGFCVKLIDFGLADPTGTVGDSGLLAGTPHYLSPEYLGGGTPPDPMLDLWSLAVTLFYAATGTLAFDGETVNDLYHRLLEERPPVPSQFNPALGPAFDAWFAKACHRDREQRFPSAAALSAALVTACHELAPSSAKIVRSQDSALATEVDLRSASVPPHVSGEGTGG
ncbi:MAG TPA: response regulator [Labilithrix sp.]|nr:response regulator [Labilithrix sp.]